MNRRTFMNWIIILVLGNGLVGCSSETPSRIKAYLGPETDTGATQRKGPVQLLGQFDFGCFAALV